METNDTNLYNIDGYVVTREELDLLAKKGYCDPYDEKNLLLVSTTNPEFHAEQRVRRKEQGELHILTMIEKMNRELRKEYEEGKELGKAKTSSKDARRAKILELKQAIKNASEELQAVRQKKENPDHDPEALRKEIVEYVSVIGGLEQELKLTIMNKTSSSAFEWIPTPMNRRQKRAFIAQQAKRNKHERNNRAKRKDSGSTGGSD